MGDTDSTSAMLSKPKPESSAGSSVRVSTSSARRSRTALAYSARFRRWTAGRRPGFGSAAAAASIAVSRRAATPSYCASLGRGRPAGGIARVRSLRTTFSHSSTSPACSPTPSKSTPCRETPAVRVLIVVATHAVARDEGAVVRRGLRQRDAGPAPRERQHRRGQNRRQGARTHVTVWHVQLLDEVVPEPRRCIIMKAPPAVKRSRGAVRAGRTGGSSPRSGA